LGAEIKKGHAVLYGYCGFGCIKKIIGDEKKTVNRTIGSAAES